MIRLKNGPRGHDSLQLYAVMSLLLPIGHGCAQQPPNKHVSYGYYYRGDLVSLTASERFVAGSEASAGFRGFVSDRGLERDPRSDQGALKAYDFGLYQLPVSPTATRQIVNLPSEIERFAETTPEEIQPVFEEGQSLLIPSNEIIVGFSPAMSLEDAQEYFAPHRETQGILDVRAHRTNSYILTIDNPANGRVYGVSQFLFGLEEIEFAEPNHLVIPVEAPRLPSLPSDTATASSRGE